MEHALALAERAIGRTSPNPPVGAVVVRDGVVVGEGWTQPPGEPHAEVMALRAAGPAAAGADLYVTLEPCTFWGRTPPCTDGITAAGVRRVFFATSDPDPRIGDGAAAVLCSSHIETIQLPNFAAQANEQMAAFRCWTTQGRPLVTAKYAMTLDGKIATHTGDSRWVSGAAARERVHQLRDRVDAILVGVGTVLADDPELTTRLAQHWRPVQHPLRIILDSHGRTPLDARLLDPELPGSTLVATVHPAEGWRREVEARGVEVLQLPADAHGRVDLRRLMRALAARRVTSVLVEGGAQVLGAFAAADLIDRLWVFVAPKLVGGRAAPGPIGEPGVALMADAQPWQVQRYEQVGNDLLVIAEPRTMSCAYDRAAHTLVTCHSSLEK
jgi:diaminohydroxyphosphoribosylaminopyrimidine deaminase/5-amino-6-(5-phosphoribosylamino)uracil reductase